MSTTQHAAIAAAYSTPFVPVEGPAVTADNGNNEKSSSKAESIATTDAGGQIIQPIAPWRYRGPILGLVIFFELAVYWASGMSSIKAIIKKELGVNNAQYGVISSASSLINSIVPFFSGALLDYYGAEICSVVASSLIFIGYLIAAIGATTGSYPALVVGEVLSGFGDITVRTSQLKISAHWFKGSHLGLVLGLAIAVQRTIGVVSKAAAVPLSDNGWYHWFFWIALILQALALTLNTIYYLFERRIPQQYRAPRGRDVVTKAREQGEPRSLKQTVSRFWSSIWLLPAFFWFLLITQLFQNGVVIAFQTLSADMIRVIRETSATKAGWVSAVGQVPVIIITPLVGIFFDRVGYRVHWIAASGVGWIIIFCLLAYTELDPIGITMLQSIPYGFNLIPLQAVIALSVGPLLQGSAQGAYQALVNSGTVIVSIAAGAIQDGSPKGKHNYDRVLIFLLAIKAWDVVAGLIYVFLDKTSLNSILSRSNKQQRQYDAKVVAGEVVPPETPMLEPKKKWTATALGVMAAQLVAAWVVYLKYSV
ncbi:hypothetical protein JCM8547_004519 [Rhodosporidiobolus lusitaniae]